MITILVTLASIIFNFTPGCEHKNDEFTCNYFSPCTWDAAAQACRFGGRGLHYNADVYSVDKKGTPKMKKWFSLGP